MGLLTGAGGGGRGGRVARGVHTEAGGGVDQVYGLRDAADDGQLADGADVTCDGGRQTDDVIATHRRYLDAERVLVVVHIVVSVVRHQLLRGLVPAQRGVEGRGVRGMSGVGRQGHETSMLRGVNGIGHQ